MSFLSLIPLRAWLIAGAVAAFGFVLWREHVAVAGRKAAQAHAAQLESTLAAERKNAAQVQADLKLSRESSNALQGRLRDIESDRAAKPIRGVFLCPRVPSTVAESGTPGGTEAATAGREPGAPPKDIGPELESYGVDCAKVGAIAAGWNLWDDQRTH